MQSHLYVLAFMAGAMALPWAATDAAGCQLQTSTTYNDTFDQLGIMTGIISGNGSMYIGGSMLNQQISATSLPPPSANNVLANYRTVNGILTMIPYQGVMKLIDMRYACSTVSGGLVANPAAIQGCTITMNCTSLYKPPVVRNLDFVGSLLPINRRFAYAQFDDSYDDLTSCTFQASTDQPLNGLTLASLYDNMGYTIKTLTAS